MPPHAASAYWLFYQQKRPAATSLLRQAVNLFSDQTKVSHFPLRRPIPIHRRKSCHFSRETRFGNYINLPPAA